MRSEPPETACEVLELWSGMWSLHTPSDDSGISCVSIFAARGEDWFKGGLPRGASGKEPAYKCRSHKRRRFHRWVGKIPWRRAWQPTPLFLLRESSGQRNLTGYSPWGGKESDTTK